MRAAAAAILMLVLALPATAAQQKRATLKLAGLAPLVVQGRGFGKGERVVLTAAAPNLQRTVGVVARRNGSFTARFGVRLGRCTPLTVRAVGMLGSRAILQLEPGCKKSGDGGPAASRAPAAIWISRPAAGRRSPSASTARSGRSTRSARRT